MSASTRQSEERKKARKARQRAKREERRQKGTVQPVAVQVLPPHVLIVCEGEKTEPLYFEGFQLQKTVKIVGEGANTLTIVERAIALRAAKTKDPYTEVWAVFDRDSHGRERFDSALGLAAREGINVAYSNQAFELWYLLHFEYCEASLDRSTYSERLSTKLRRRYRKNDRQMFEILEEYAEQASQRAQMLLDWHADVPLYDACPSTTVFRLVDRLFELRR